MQATLAPIFNELQTNGVKSLNGIADELNRRSAPTPRAAAAGILCRSHEC